MVVHKTMEQQWLDGVERRGEDDCWQRKSAVDPRYKKGMARGGRYKRLADLMGIPKEDCHIGMFDVERCRQAVLICESGALETQAVTT